MALVQGSAGNDRLFGSSGNDVLNANWSSGDDVMQGGTGDDVYHVNSRGDRVVEAANAGIDTVLSGISFTLGDHVEHLTLLGVATVGIGNGLDNDLIGNAAANVLVGLAGNDRLAGGAGDDRLDGGDGNDRLDGGAGDDRLDGGEGDDRLDGGPGADVMAGGRGNDTYVVDSAADRIVEVETPYDPADPESWYQQYDTVITSIDLSLSSTVYVEEVRLQGDARNATGNQLDNVLQGTSAANVLDGRDGHDVLYGFGGADVLIGGDGVDELDGGTGIDTMRGGDGADTYWIDTPADQVIEAAGDEGGDMVISSANVLLLYANVEGLRLWGMADYAGGNALDNFIFGWANDDTLHGRGGNDYLVGDAGRDRVDGGAGDDRIVGGTEQYGFDEAADVLTGGSGHDTFVFVTLYAGMPVDRITDFDAHDDRLNLLVYDGVDGLVDDQGQVLASAVHVGVGLNGMGRGAAGLYVDTSTGHLWLDTTSGIAGDGMLFAQVSASAAAKITADDFVLG